MRVSRLRLATALVLLLLVAAACGNDPEAAAPGDEESAAAAPAEESEAPTEDMASEASEASSEASEMPSEGGSEVAAGESIVPLEQVCEEDYADVEAPEGFTIGLVTDIGSVDDGTFNQYAFEGMEAAAECFGAETEFIETQNQADYQNNLNTILGAEPDIVVTVGFLLADATLEFANDNEDVNFVGIDQFQEEFPDNYVGVLFREDQGGYLAGAMAGLLTESNVVGVVGGLEDVPPVVRLVNGYEAGATAENPDVDVLSVYNTSFTDPAKGRSDGEQMLGEGADVIFGAGGQTGSGGIQAAAEDGAWAIGVDQDEYFTTFDEGNAVGSEFLATSAVKRVDLGVFEQVAAAINDEFAGGVFELNAENDGITYAPAHDAAIPPEVLARMEEIRAGLADGSIDTGIDPVTGLPLDE